KMAKQRRDSADIYLSQNRDDLAETELAQLNVIQEFLPPQMSPKELEEEVKKIIAEMGATSMKDMGKVMGVATKQLAGKANGRLISEVVKKLLS
ncbi:MAG: GatB/YqeY domain-containing protein, partial [Dysgonamonadaceae bacterium]|nr:GatB/YqeY domain-containing protein [Dysgonamonadaceae bacterium]